MIRACGEGNGEKGCLRDAGCEAVVVVNMAAEQKQSMGRGGEK